MTSPLPRNPFVDAYLAFLLQATVIEMGNTLGVVVMASVLRISVVRGVLEAAKVDSHGKRRVGNERYVCLS